MSLDAYEVVDKLLTQLCKIEILLGFNQLNRTRTDPLTVVGKARHMITLGAA